MSKITKEEVEKTAFLARVYKKGQFPDQELEQFTNNLSSVINNADELNSINVDGVDFKSGWRTTSIEDLRDDEPSSDQDTYKRVRQNIINNFPLAIDNMCAVDGVFNNN